MSIASMTNSDTRIYPELGDTGSFGSSLAADKSHIIVGDKGANRVLIYQRNSSGNWFRVRAIQCPEDSPFTAIGHGFGHSLALDGNILVIGALAGTKLKKEDDSDSRETKMFPFRRPETDLSSRYIFRDAGAVYRTTVNEVSSIQRVDVSTEEELVGDLVAADRGNIAYHVKSSTKNCSCTVLVSGERSYCLRAFGDFALKGQQLAVVEHDKILLFDLQSPWKHPQEILIPFTNVLVQIDMSDNFIAVGSRISPSQQGFHMYEDETLIREKSLIFRLEDGASYVIEGYGKVALNRDLLVRSFSWVPFRNGQLEIFSLHSSSEPQIISKESDYGSLSIDCLRLTNDFLVATRRPSVRHKLRRQVENVYQAIYINELRK
jgi:hypothetical protein